MTKTKIVLSDYCRELIRQKGEEGIELAMRLEPLAFHTDESLKSRRFYHQPATLEAHEYAGYVVERPKKSVQE